MNGSRCKVVCAGTKESSEMFHLDVVGGLDSPISFQFMTVVKQMTI
jgi:hypothetical protein